MTISSDLVRLDFIKNEFRPHLKEVAVRDGVAYTTTEKIAELSHKPLFKEIKEEALHKRMMANRNDFEGDDNATKQTEKWRNT